MKSNLWLFFEPCEKITLHLSAFLTLKQTTLSSINRARTAARQMSTNPHMAINRPPNGVHASDIPKSFGDLKKNIWLSDPGAYPVLIVLGFATTLSASFITYCVMRGPDVRVSFGRRQQLIRDWE